jgi:hypothetical protein
MRNKTITILFVMLSVAFASGTGEAFAGNWIVGSASIRNDTGQNVYGERLAVFLVSRKNPVSAKIVRLNPIVNGSWTASITAIWIFINAFRKICSRPVT